MFYILQWAPVNLLYIRAHECVQARLPAKNPEATLHSLWTHYKLVELTPAVLLRLKG